MEMEDHHHHNHHQIHHPYTITDLRQLITANNSPTAGGPAIPPPPPSFEALMMMRGSGGGGVRPMPASEMMPLGLGHHMNPFHHHHHDAVATSSLSGGGGGMEPVDGGGGLAGDGGTGRWPRQETLTLLEIRSRLDSKFKEANQKGPLWDEVSRIMCEEHAYQRSGKKCREKFENLYKYYKKTKEGKAGRQDGKHYRFFRQLEALYGETSNVNNNQVITNTNYGNNLQFHARSHNDLSHEGFNNVNTNNNNTSLSLSNNNSSEFESSYSSDYDNNNRTRSRGWKAKIKEFIDAQMRKLMEKQEAWLERLMKTLEQKERERSLREEDWRAKEAARIEREHRFWAKERAWIEARDSALMEALKNLTGKEQLLLNVDHHHDDNNDSTELGLNPNCNNNNNNVDGDDQDGSDEIHGNDNVGKGEHHHHHQHHHNGWLEPEISRLIQLRTSMESRFEEGGFLEEVLWEEIAAKMVCLGFERRSGSICREKWESINGLISSISLKSSHLKKKRKDDSRECDDYGHFHNHNNNECNSTSLYNYHENCDQINEGTSSSPSNANVGTSGTTHHHHNVVNHDTCFPFLIGEGSDHLWENYGLKINKGGQN